MSIPIDSQCTVNHSANPSYEGIIAAHNRKIDHIIMTILI